MKRAWRSRRRLWSVLVALGCVVALDGLLCFVIVVASTIGRLQEGSVEAYATAVRIRTVLYAGPAAILAWGRIVTKYPADDRRYLQWLRLTPWTIRRPLPLGSCLPTWGDVAIVAVLTALALGGPLLHPAAVPLAATCTYFLCGTAQLVRARRWRNVLVCAALIVLAALLREPWWILSIAIIGVILLRGGCAPASRVFN